MASYLDCIVVDAADHARLGSFWAAALGVPAEVDERVTRLKLHHDGGPTLHLDFVPVPDRIARPHRLHLDLNGGPEHERLSLVDRFVELGAQHIDIGQGDVPWTVLVDPEDYAFCVMPDREVYRGGRPLGALPLDAEDPPRAAKFWAAATGWTLETETTLRHPSGRGPVLGLCDPVEPKRGKNPVHLDIAVEPTDDYDDELARLLDAGASRLIHDWGELPWTVLLDPCGNEFCLLRAAD